MMKQQNKSIETIKLITRNNKKEKMREYLLVIINKTKLQ